MDDDEPAGMDLLRHAGAFPHRTIEDDGKDIKRPVEQQHRGVAPEEMRNCPLRLGQEYTITTFNMDTGLNDTYRIAVTGLFIDGYAYIRLN